MHDEFNIDDYDLMNDTDIHMFKTFIGECHIDLGHEVSNKEDLNETYVSCVVSNRSSNRLILVSLSAILLLLPLPSAGEGLLLLAISLQTLISSLQVTLQYSGTSGM